MQERSIEDNLLDISLPTVGFEEHIKNPINKRILFSAPFGQGKTTFLDCFFQERSEEYNVIKLFPVNYSVASNEDIFKYIKYAILLQLILNKAGSFEEDNISDFDKLKCFFGSKIEVICGSILTVLPKIVNSEDVKTVAVITALAQAGSYIQSKYEKYIETNFKVEHAEVKEFIDSFFKIGLYEDDFYTQLIRDLLSRDKTNQEGKEKENVLIIDDMDRVDPDHLFRLLNVFSAHYDTYKEVGGEENKFGFDKIIIVCDIQNIQSIYAHKYGRKTDFSGYISKFSSGGVYEYDNYKVIRKVAEQLLPETDKFPIERECFDSIVEPLVLSGKLKLRDLLKIDKQRFQFNVTKLVNKNSFTSMIGYGFLKSAFSPTIILLTEVFGSRVLISQINLVNDSYFKEDLKKVTYCLMYGLYDSSKVQIYYTSPFSEVKYYLSKVDSYESTLYSSLTVKNLYDLDGNEIPNWGGKVNVTKEEFKDILIKNVEKYDSIKNIQNI